MQLPKVFYSFENLKMGDHNYYWSLNTTTWVNINNFCLQCRWVEFFHAVSFSYFKILAHIHFFEPSNSNLSGIIIIIITARIAKVQWLLHIVNQLLFSTGYHDQLSVGLIAQLVKNSTHITGITVQILFRPEFFRSSHAVA